MRQCPTPSLMADSELQFNLETARRFAQAGRIEEWIHAYLGAGAWANAGLSDGLKLQRRWWRGPCEMLLDQMVRMCGPEPDMMYRVDEAGWIDRTGRYARSLTDAAALPPLLVEYRDGVLRISDGNHRHEAMRIRGWHMCWVLIWYNSAEDYWRHTSRLIEAGGLNEAS
jgi:hypothetical protein